MRLGPGVTCPKSRLFRMQSRSRWSQSRSCFVLPGPLEQSVLFAGVGDEVSVDDVRDPAFQSPDCFFGGLALGDFAVVELAAQRVASEL